MRASVHKFSSKMPVKFARLGLGPLLMTAFFGLPGLPTALFASGQKPVDLPIQPVDRPASAADSFIIMPLADNLFSDETFSVISQRVSVDYPFLNLTLAKSSEGFKYTTASDDGALAAVHDAYKQSRTPFYQHRDQALAKRIRNVDFRIAELQQTRGVWEVLVSFELTKGRGEKYQTILLDGVMATSCNQHSCRVDLRQAVDEQEGAPETFSGSLVCLSLPAGRNFDVARSCPQVLINIKQQDAEGGERSAYVVARNLPKQITISDLRAFSERTVGSAYSELLKAILDGVGKQWLPDVVRDYSYYTYEVYRGVSGFFFRFRYKDQEFVFEGPLVETTGHDLKTRMVRLNRKTRPLATSTRLKSLNGYIEDKVALPFVLENSGRGEMTLAFGVARELVKDEDYDEGQAVKALAKVRSQELRRQIVEILGESASRKFDFLTFTITTQPRDLRLDRVQEEMAILLN